MGNIYGINEMIQLISKYVATKDNATTVKVVEKEHSSDNLMLMLFRQNGSAEKYWKDFSFYWPLLVVPNNTKKTFVEIN